MKPALGVAGDLAAVASTGTAHLRTVIAGFDRALNDAVSTRRDQLGAVGVAVRRLVTRSSLLMLSIGFVFFRSLLGQINQTTRQIQNMSSGRSDNNEILSVLRHDEVGELRLSRSRAGLAATHGAYEHGF